MLSDDLVTLAAERNDVLLQEELLLRRVRPVTIQAIVCRRWMNDLLPNEVGVMTPETERGYRVSEIGLRITEMGGMAVKAPLLDLQRVMPVLFLELI